VLAHRLQRHDQPRRPLPNLSVQGGRAEGVRVAGFSVTLHPTGLFRVWA